MLLALFQNYYRYRTLVQVVVLFMMDSVVFRSMTNVFVTATRTEIRIALIPRYVIVCVGEYM